MIKKGKGFYQNILRKITEIQIVYTLLEKPMRFNQIKEKTEIHGSLLKKVLRDFEQKGIVIRHKFSLNKKYFKVDEQKKFRSNSFHYILNLDNLKTKELIADPTILFMEEYLEENEYLSDTDFEKFGFSCLKKLKNVSAIPNPYDYVEIILILDVRKRVEDDFLSNDMIPILKEEKRKRIQIADKILKEKKEEYAKIQEIKTTNKRSFEDENFEKYVLFRSAKQVCLMIMEKIINEGGTKWDFLIYMCSDLSFKNSEFIYQPYQYLWKIVHDRELI